MVNAKISIVVPVYNVEKYLHRCIDSILAQSFKDFELLIINDGSTDNSGAICDEYAEKDQRIRLFHKANGGVNSARALGIKNAKGEYLMFVDSDDSISNDALVTLYQEMRNGKYSIVISDEKIKQRDISKEQYCHKMIAGTLPSFLWGKLFAVSLFSEDILNIPREIIKGEDMLINVRLAFANMKSVRMVNRCIYNYLQRPESCVHTFTPTVDYEYMFHIYRMLSIPEEQRDNYIIDTIESRVNALRHIAMHNKANTSYKCSAFYEGLHVDMKKCNYKMFYLDKLMLEPDCIIIRRLAIIVFRINRKLSKMWKYW